MKKGALSAFFVFVRNKKQINPKNFQKNYQTVRYPAPNISYNRVTERHTGLANNNSLSENLFLKL
ncbi:hypothetical protein GCM10009193_31060 [Shewanella aestuarii]|nr:hypothetical protein GCM10009193_31060 [Shewanella aestuarii]